MCNETKNTEIGYDNGGKRTDGKPKIKLERQSEIAYELNGERGNKRNEEDLDSFSVGSESTAKVKIYYNGKVDTEDDLLPRIDLAVVGTLYLKNKLRTGGAYK